MTLRPMRDEIDAGRRSVVDRHARRVDALVGPQLEQATAESIVADASDVSTRCAEPRSGDRHVRRIATESLHISERIVGARLVELDQRLAQRKNWSPHACGLIDQFGRGAAPGGGAIRASGRPFGAHVFRGSARNAAAYAAAPART